MSLSHIGLLVYIFVGYLLASIRMNIIFISTVLFSKSLNSESFNHSSLNLS